MPNRMFRRLDDNALALTVHDLELQLDKLADATHPSAGVERARVLDELDAAREELDRRVLA